MNALRLSKLVTLLLVWMSVGSNGVPLEGSQIMGIGMGTGSKLHKRRANNKKEVENKVPWHLDRIDQQHLPLDNSYVPLGNAKSMYPFGLLNFLFVFFLWFVHPIWHVIIGEIKMMLWQNPRRCSGVDIYIFAEGIQYDHEVFDGRASNGGFMPDQKCGRIGTELASLAAGKFVGVATAARIYSINILKCELYTSPKVVVDALDYVVQRTMNNTEGRRSIIVLPLVRRNSPNFNAIVKKVVDSNIVVVTPAGNYRDDACKYSPGNSPSAINVGATQKNDKMYQHKSGGSNFGDCVSLYAPGHSIIAADDNHGYSKISGTHAACGIVAGAAALVLEKFKNYTPAEVKQHLLGEATNGVVEIPKMFDMLYDTNVNKFLYVGDANNVEQFSAK